MYLLDLSHLTNYVVYFFVTFQITTPKCLQELSNVKQEFIPFFLNYLRDHTIHLIQSSKSATPSPAKTPSLKKLQKSVKKGCQSNRKRQQLFGASPATDKDEDLRALPSSVFSPNTSLDSPGNSHFNVRADKHFTKGGFHGNHGNQKCSPQCGSHQRPNQQTPEQRSKQRLSLAEFMVTPEQGNNLSNNWRKKSPHSGGKKEFSIDITPSSGFQSGRKSAGKKRHSYSPLVQNNLLENSSNNCNAGSAVAPVFSLSSSNDFPPMCSRNVGRKGTQNRRSLDSNLSAVKPNACDIKTSRVINFSNNNSCDTNVVGKYAQERLKDVKRISPVTIQNSTLSVRRITPTLVKADNSVTQNSAFLVPINEVEKTNVTNGDTKCDKSSQQQKSARDALMEERDLIK